MSQQTLVRLSVKHLSCSFHTDEVLVPAVADVSFDIAAGKTTALVGESGSGKSVTGLTLLQLLSRSSRTSTSGEAWFVDRAGQSRDLMQQSESQMRTIRGNQIAMIFQEPMTCLNPVFTVGEQIAESLRLHKRCSRAEALTQTQRMLDLVEIPAAAQRMHEYPHQLSGGMRQRVMIALAMACDPLLLIADEPTTALDVTIQAQILALMKRLQDETGMSILFVTHNLGVVAHHADHVAVMYAGRIVERAPVLDLFASPLHPYTRGLLSCLPGHSRGQRLKAIPGQVASPLQTPPGCAFAERCELRDTACEQAMPALRQLGEPSRVANLRHVRCVRAPTSLVESAHD
jgi:peptide/nickel transport system ATP-binding protein